MKLNYILAIACFMVGGFNAYLGFTYGHWFNWFVSGFALFAGLFEIYVARKEKSHD